jgi:PEP-CTERM motif
MRTMLTAVAASMIAVATPALAQETISASFTTPDGGVTTGLFSGTVRIDVTGTGQSLSTQFNDAFYLLPGGTHDGSYYQLTFGTTTLTGLNPAQNAVNFIVGGLPAFNATNSYSFLLNTGTATPSQLHFGVGDGNFGDNSGAYRITISPLAGAVPEPASWALMILGFGAVGAVLRRRHLASEAAFTAHVRAIAASGGG